MDKIEQIASKVLGKTSDGKTMMRYETPKEIDNSLLVAVPRYLNREQYNIKEDQLPFVGLDVWHAYEFSSLLDNGFPVSGCLKLVYSSDSRNIVESKSLKLYLNSFNMVKLAKTKNEAIQLAESIITKDLSNVIETDVKVKIFLENTYTIEPFTDRFKNLDNINIDNISFNSYNEDPQILKVYDIQDSYAYLKSSALRSNCRVTNQPDWGDIFIYYKGDKAVTEASLLQYIVSMRSENHFHEEICECVYKRLYDLLEPKELLVACLYTRRGGIDINPIRYSNQELISKVLLSDVNTLTNKTMRQ